MSILNLKLNKNLIFTLIGMFGITTGSALAKTKTEPALKNIKLKTSSIPKGKFSPLFGLNADQTEFEVEAFLIDQKLVTEGEFYHFTQKYPQWKKENAPKLYRDLKYLSHWKHGKPNLKNLNYPIVYVSWFAANEYCAQKGGRLPTTLEWEYVAAADTLRAYQTPNALSNTAGATEFKAKILAWYSKPSRGVEGLREIGQKNPNYYSLYDMHDLVWEWTSDFNSSFITSDNRQDGEQSKNLFCGDGATGANNREDYPSFMRYAMRGSLQSTFSLGNLGFRCAYDQKK